MKPLKERIVTAIHEQKLPDLVAHLSDTEQAFLDSESGELLTLADQALKSVERDCLDARTELCESLRNAGIQIADDPPDNDVHRTQFHTFSIDVAPEEAAAAIDIALQSGYRAWTPLDGAAWKLFCTTSSEITLTLDDAVTMRAVIRWRRLGPVNSRRTFLTPNLADATWLPLPTALWRLSYLVRPMRILSETLRGARKPELGPYLGTPRMLLPALFDFANVTKSDTVLDLGSGDGRVVCSAARDTGCSATGYELDADLCRLARQCADNEGVADRVTIHNADATSADLSTYSLVFLFLPSSAVGDLIPALLQKLPSGARIVAHEQTAMDFTPKPSKSEPLIVGSAITVAHLWRVE